ncbi:MAG: hypothetical protein K2M17_00285, partial [Bacilli bacterium]|nr:hypothetical protein [Bacilli bacterium]
MKVTSKINIKGMAQFYKLATETLVETVDAIEKDLKRSKTMPFDTGNLQNRSMFVDDSKKDKGIVALVYDTPYA